MKNLRHYYIDDGLSEIVTITGSGMYETNQVKRYAENMLRKYNPSSKITAIILNHRNVTLEEYR